MMKIICGKKTTGQENEYHKYQRSVRLKRCPSAVKSLFSNESLKALVPSLCVLVLVIHGLGQKLYDFVAAIFVPQYHYQYVVSICFGQVAFSLLFMNILHLLGLVPLRGYSRALGERLLVPSICSSVHGVLSMWAKANSLFSGLFLLVSPLLPVLTLALTFILKLASTPSAHISVLISFVSGTSLVITVSFGLSDAEFLEYIYAPLALILHSVSLTWLAKVYEAVKEHSPDAQVSIFDIYYSHLVNQGWVLGLLWVLHTDNPWYVLKQGSWHSLLFHGYLLAILLLGMALNFLVGMTVFCFSPVSAAVLHSAYQISLPYLHLL